jgi:hypothetical protein
MGASTPIQCKAEADGKVRMEEGEGGFIPECMGSVGAFGGWTGPINRLVPKQTDDLLNQSPGCQK